MMVQTLLTGKQRMFKPFGVDTATLEYLGLDAEEFGEYFSELDGVDKNLCSVLIDSISSHSDQEQRGKIKRQIYDILDLVSDDEMEDVLNNWEEISDSV